MGNPAETTKSTEWYWFNQPFFLNNFDLTSPRYSSVLETTLINLQEQSSNRIPGLIKAVCIQLGAADSNSSSSNCWVNLYRDDSNLYVLQRNIGTYNGVGPSLPNNTWSQEQGIVPCDTNGNISFRCRASGIQTLGISIIVIGYAM